MKQITAFRHLKALIESHRLALCRRTVCESKQTITINSKKESVVFCVEVRGDKSESVIGVNALVEWNDAPRRLRGSRVLVL